MPTRPTSRTASSIIASPTCRARSRAPRPSRSTTRRCHSYSLWRKRAGSRRLPTTAISWPGSISRPAASPILRWRGRLAPPTSHPSGRPDRPAGKRRESLVQGFGQRGDRLVDERRAPFGVEILGQHAAHGGDGDVDRRGADLVQCLLLLERQLLGRQPPATLERRRQLLPALLRGAFGFGARLGDDRLGFLECVALAQLMLGQGLLGFFGQALRLVDLGFDLLGAAVEHTEHRTTRLPHHDRHRNDEGDQHPEFGVAEEFAHDFHQPCSRMTASTAVLTHAGSTTAPASLPAASWATSAASCRTPWSAVALASAIRRSALAVSALRLSASLRCCSAASAASRSAVSRRACCALVRASLNARS